MGQFGLADSEFNTQSSSSTDFTTCPFTAHKDEKWDEIPIQYMLWILNNVEDLHNGYIQEISKHTQGYALCENKHVYETFISDECYICQTEEIT